MLTVVGIKGRNTTRDRGKEKEKTARGAESETKKGAGRAPAPLFGSHSLPMGQRRFTVLTMKTGMERSKRARGSPPWVPWAVAPHTASRVTDTGPSV